MRKATVGSGSTIGELKKKVIKVLYLAETGHRGNHICHLKYDGSTIGP